MLNVTPFSSSAPEGEDRLAPASAVAEIHALIHPFFMGENAYNLEGYCDLWCSGLAEAGASRGSLLVIQFPHMRFRPDLETKLLDCAEEATGKVREDEFQCGSLPWDTQSLWYDRNDFPRALILRGDGIGPSAVFNEQIASKLADRKAVTVSGRGAYYRHCVKGGVQAICSAYNIPYENSFIDPLASIERVWTGERPVMPQIDTLRAGQRELSTEAFDAWMDEIRREFHQPVHLLQSGWENVINPICIKSYADDVRFLEREFGDLCLRCLAEEDFLDAQKSRRAAIAYQFLVCPGHFYDGPGGGEAGKCEELSVKAPKPDLHNPRPWQASWEEVLRFRDILCDFLLGADVPLSAAKRMRDKALALHPVTVDFNRFLAV